MKKRYKYIILFCLLFPLTGLLVSRNNPPISNKVNWDSGETKNKFMHACADCHSYHTKWPWYSYVAPMAFLVSHNVNEGRGHFNISVANMGDSNEAGEELLESKMPRSEYLILHPEAKFSKEEILLFAKGLNKTFGTNEHKLENYDHH